MVHRDPFEPSSSTLTSRTATTPPPPQDIIPLANDILRDLRTESPLGIYGATHNLQNRAEYFLGGWDSGDMLVLKKSADLTELVIRGVFDVSRSEFYFTPDANFDPANSFNSKLEDVKLSCRLTASRHADFKFASDDFPTIVDNLRKIEKLIQRQPDSQSLSVVDSICGTETIRLSHSLFKVSLIIFTPAYCSLIYPRKKNSMRMEKKL
jgi:hypothetical protein